MPSANDDEAGIVIRTLREFRGGCGWTCGTCGGYSGTVSRLRSAYLDDRSAYLSQLAALGAADFVDIGSTAPLARAALDVVSNPLQRARVLDSWAEVLDVNPHVGIVMLHVVAAHLQLSRRFMRAMFTAAREQSVLADHLATLLGAVALQHDFLRTPARAAVERAMNELAGWEDFQRRADHERALKVAAWEREWAERERARVEEVARLRTLPLEERFRAMLAADKPIAELEEELAEASDEELGELQADRALEMARQIGSSAAGAWLDVRSRLLAVHAADQKKRQQLRGEPRQREISVLSAYSAAKRLAHVAREEQRPLGYWPAKWAMVDDDVLATLDVDSRVKLVARIRDEAGRLRSHADREVWRDLARRLLGINPKSSPSSRGST
jgi:hypothetical protein